MKDAHTSMRKHAADFAALAKTTGATLPEVGLMHERVLNLLWEVRAEALAEVVEDIAANLSDDDEVDELVDIASTPFEVREDADGTMMLGRKKK